MAIIGNQQRIIGAKGQAIRPALIFRQHVPTITGTDQQDAAIWDIGDQEAPRTVKAGAFQETINRRAGAIGIRPGGAAHLAKPIRQAGEGAERKLLGGGEPHGGRLGHKSSRAKPSPLSFDPHHGE